MSDSAKSKINVEIKRWIIMSQKFRTSAHISYGKVRSHLAIYESAATKAEIIKLQSDLGNKLKKFWSIFLFLFRKINFQNFSKCQCWIRKFNF